jgi:hypothetical protein
MTAIKAELRRDPPLNPHQSQLVTAPIKRDRASAWFDISREPDVIMVASYAKVTTMVTSYAKRGGEGTDAG